MTIWFGYGRYGRVTDVTDGLRTLRTGYGRYGRVTDVTDGYGHYGRVTGVTDSLQYGTCTRYIACRFQVAVWVN
jgi:hypothetical protein